MHQSERKGVHECISQGGSEGRRGILKEEERGKASNTINPSACKNDQLDCICADSGQ